MWTDGRAYDEAVAGKRDDPMTQCIVIEDGTEIPLNIQSLSDFRQWAMSPSFPGRGRIDYLAGRIEVDMSPEDFFCHGTLKTELIAVLGRLVKQRESGYVVSDRSRISNVSASMSAEPDVMFVSHRSLSEGRVKLMPKAGGEPGRFMEIEGSPDLVVEIVSDSSQVKDTRYLPKAYFAAGVEEFWLADARGREMRFAIHCRGGEGFEAVTPDAEGFMASLVMGRRFRLDRCKDAQGYWSFTLLNEALS